MKMSRSNASSEGSPKASMQREADRVALSIYRQLLHGTAVDQRHVLYAVRAEAVGYSSERTQLALNALKACQHDEGRSSRGAYDRWRQRQTPSEQWPSSQYIFNTFDGWTRALDAAGADVVGDVLSRRILRDTRGMSRDDILAAIKAYAATGRKLTFQSYYDWAQKEIRNPDREVERLVRSQRTIQKYFGSWGQLLAMAGLAQTMAADQRRNCAPGGVRGDYQPPRVKRWLKKAAKVCGGSKMTTTGYDRWAQQQTAKAAQGGRMVFVPRSQVAIKLFGSWADVLHAIGEISATEAHRRRGRRNASFSDDELLSSLAIALRDRGPTLRMADYESWRSQLRAGQGKDDVRPPGAVLLRKRLGGWPAACAAAVRFGQRQGWLDDAKREVTIDG